MVSPRIELRSRDIKMPNALLKSTDYPQHLYIVATLANGLQVILRAGPSNNNMATGDLEILYERYASDMKDTNAKHDWQDDPSQYRSTILFETDEDTGKVIGYIMNQIAQIGEVINKAKYDYKLPICDMAKITFMECNQQNSNSVIRQMLDLTGIKFALPKWPDGREVFAPGINSKIDHSILDGLIKLHDGTLDYEGYGTIKDMREITHKQLEEIKAELEHKKLLKEAEEKAHNDHQEALRVQADKAVEEWNHQQVLIEGREAFSNFMAGYTFGRLSSYSAGSMHHSTSSPIHYTKQPYISTNNLSVKHHSDGGSSISDDDFHVNISPRTLGIRSCHATPKCDVNPMDNAVYYYDTDTGLPIMGI